MAWSCSSLGHSSRPWRFNSSRIQPFWGPQADSPKVPIGGTTSGTLLTGVTFPTSTLVGITMGWAVRFLRQISTWKEHGHISPYVVVGMMETGSWGPHAGSASMWTCIQCPWMSVLLWTLMVPNRGMLTFHVVWICPWTLSRQNSFDAVGLGASLSLEVSRLMVWAKCLSLTFPHAKASLGVWGHLSCSWLAQPSWDVSSCLVP